MIILSHTNLCPRGTTSRRFYQYFRPTPTLANPTCASNSKKIARSRGSPCTTTCCPGSHLRISHSRPPTTRWPRTPLIVPLVCVLQQPKNTLGSAQRNTKPLQFKRHTHFPKFIFWSGVEVQNGTTSWTSAKKYTLFSTSLACMSVLMKLVLPLWLLKWYYWDFIWFIHFFSRNMELDLLYVYQK